MIRGELEQQVPGLKLVEEKIQYESGRDCADELAGQADCLAVALHSGAAKDRASASLPMV